MRDRFIKGVFFSKARIAMLVVAMIAGGISAQATGLINTPSGGYLICVNGTSKVVSHPGTSTCPKGSKRIVLGAQGKAGVDGITGAAGIPGKDGLDGKDGKTLWNGTKDPENTWGAPGDMFINSVTRTLFGPKNLDGTWPVGVSMIGPKGDPGSIGQTGPTGPQGPTGVSAIGPTGPSSLKITELYICGANGTSLCKVGVQGPGGGLVFFVDYYDQYSNFNYLEAAPESCQGQRTWTSHAIGTYPLVSGASGWAARAVGRGRVNTDAIVSADPSGTIANNAAMFARSCTAGGKSDWYLPSVGEMSLVVRNLQGLGDFQIASYWTSTDSVPGAAMNYELFNEYPTQVDKFDSPYVRPVRIF